MVTMNHYPGVRPTVSAEVQAARLAVCESCEKRRATDGHGDVCISSCCGRDPRIEAMVTRAEVGPVRWCRHPKRGEGCGWAVPIGSVGGPRPT